MSKIFVFGHKKPDTDSVTAAISLSYLKQVQGVNAVPKVLGRLNNETKFVLKKFNMKPPEYLNDVKMQIKDVNYNKSIINKNTSIKDCYDFLKNNKLNGIPVVGNEKELIGILTQNDISSHLIDGDYTKLITSYENIIKILNGEEILKYDDEIKGNILVASYKSTTFLDNIELDKDTILIVGDRHSILEYAVLSSVKIIIIIGNGEIKEEHLEIARKNKVNIIRTKYDTFHTSKLINLSNYIDNIIITRDPIKFDNNDYLNDFIEISNETKHTTYPIVDKNNICLGLLRLVDINNKQKKRVILVDHNDIAQSVDGLEEAEVIEVIDHHRLGALVTNSPINFRNMAVGSTNTIIYNLYQESKVEIPKLIAGVMLSGIISDTLLLKSPTTTNSDISAVKRLSAILDIDYEKYGMEMFKAGSSLKGKSIEEILFTDFKVFKVGNIEAGIGQIFTTDYNSLSLDIDKYVDTLNKVSTNNDYLVVALFVTDVIKNGSYIIYNNKSKRILEDSFNIDELSQEYYFENIVSRKKQIIPLIIDVLERK